MKKTLSLLILPVGLVLSCLSACKKISENEQHLLSEFSGKWAEVDENNLSERYLDFFMGKCYDYTCRKPHYIEEGTMYDCWNLKRTLSAETTFTLPDNDHIQIGDGPLEPFQRIGIKRLRIGDKTFEHFNNFNIAQHPSFEVHSIEILTPTLYLNLGNEWDLRYRIEPEQAIPDTLIWSSDRYDIIHVDDKGHLRANAIGSATITVHTGGCSASCRVSVRSDLSVNGNANCYIVSSHNTSYSFPADVKGNSKLPIEGIDSAVVVWETRGNLEETRPNDIVRNVKLSGNEITFMTGEFDGNALIAVVDNQKNILWSWHIWSCEGYDPIGTAHVYSRNAGTMMDRNLGATTLDPARAEFFGLFYQWGRKEPFPGPGEGNSSTGTTQARYTLGAMPKRPSDATVGTVEYAIAHPQEFILSSDGTEGDWVFAQRIDTLWTGGKSIYDPCPPGWRVPDGMNSKRDGNNVWFTAMNKPVIGYRTNSSWGYNNTPHFNLTDPLSSSPYKVYYPNGGGIAGNSGNIISVCHFGFYWTNTPWQNSVINILLLNYDNQAYGIYPAHPWSWVSERGQRAYGLSVRCQKMM